MISRYKAKIGERIEIYANGCTYEGVLTAMSDREIYLKSVTKTWAIPIDRIQKLVYVADKKTLAQKKEDAY